MEFKWTPECEKCFQILKEFLKQAPILRYPNPQASYTLYTDAAKYVYAGILTQHNDGVDHPITYVSGLFCGSQLNWATLTKEAYAIYMSIKKLSFYIDTAKITVRSDHLPLKKFLEKNTMNSKVNNWAVEGKEGEAQTEGQAAEGAQAPPEGILPAPIPVPTDPLPGTSTGPTQDPTVDPTQDPTQTPGEVEIKLTQYVKDYRAAGKVWLDTVVQEKEKAYDTLYDRLQQLGAPHKEGLDQADRQQVYNCIKDRTGMYCCRTRTSCT